MKRSATNCLILIVFIAALVRLWGVTFNLPYFENTDEIFVINMSKFVSLNGYNQTNYLNLYYPYPPFLYLINSIVYNVYSFFSGMPLDSIPRGDLGLISRIITVFFGTATVLITYFIGKKSYNGKVGLIASATIAVMFLHVTNSQLAKNDIITTFFGSIAVYYAIASLKDKPIKNYLLSAFFAGISTATLYQGIFFIVPLLTVHSLNILNRDKNNSFLKINLKIIPIICFFLFGFFAVNPYYLISLKEVGFYQHINLLNHFVAMWVSDSGIVTWKWYLEYLWSYGLYYPIFISFVGGIVLVAKREEKAGAVLLSIFLVYGTALISKTYYTDRLLLPITPTVAVISAYFLYNVLECLQNRNFAFNNLKIHGKTIWIFIILIVFSISLLKVAIGNFYLSQPTPLQQTEAWIDKNVPDGSRIFFTANSFPFSPNSLEKKYNITYYSPEMAQYPVDAFSLKYDYILYYWGSNLPTEFNLTISQMDAKKKFDFKIPDNLPLKPFVKLSSPWFSARLYYYITSSIIPLNTSPQDNYAFMDGVYYEGGILRGNILYFKSNITDKNRILVTRDLIKPGGTNGKEAKHDFKTSLKPMEFNFSLDMKTKNLILKPANIGNSIGMERDLLEFLNREFNLGQEHETRFELTNEDLVSYAGWPQPSGKNDFVITVKNVSKQIEKVQIFNRNQDQTWVGPHDGIHATDLYKQNLNSKSVSIYIEPVEGVQDAKLEVYLFYTDNTVDIIGNK